MLAESLDSTDRTPPYTSIEKNTASFVSNFLKGGPTQVRLDASDILTESSSTRTLQQIKQTSARSTLLNESFRKVHSHVHQIDNLGLQGRGGTPLPKLKPEWDKIHKEYKDLLWKSRDFASDGIDTLLLYSNTIMPKLYQKTYDIKEILDAVDWFLNEHLNEFKGKERAQEISDGFKDLSFSVAAFREKVNATMQEAKDYNGERYKLCQSQLEKLNAELATLEHQVASDEQFSTIVSKLSPDGFIGNVLADSENQVALGLFVGSALLSVGFWLFSTRNRNNLHAAQSGIQVKQAEIERLKEQKEALVPMMGQAEQDIETIREQLLVISDIFHSVRMECKTLQSRLQVAVNPASPPIISNGVIGMIKPHFQYLLCALKAYANGLPTATVQGEMDGSKDDVIFRSQKVSSPVGSIFLVVSMCMCVLVIAFLVNMAFVFPI
ncbi:hypothetical protein CPB86DRAFT_878582 [Serendipita vermifera]|nr:hypothetical protein CPB86DRAFT_878582 [Serendipita vermifera]